MRVSALEGHRIWAASYETTPNPLLALEARILPEKIGRVALKQVVDVACGNGRWAARIAESGANVLGVDFCAEMLERAAPNLRGRLVLADAGWLPLSPEIADLTICSFALGYFPDLDRAFSEIARITKYEGRFVLSDMHPEAVAAGWTRSFRAGGLKYEMEHFGYSLEEIRSAARKNFQLESEVDGYFGDPEKTIFEMAGKDFAETAKVPAVWIASWRRT